MPPPHRGRRGRPAPRHSGTADETRREPMRTRPAFWLIQALIVASFLFIRSDSPALAQTATVSLDAATLVPYHGLRASGVTITAAVNSSQTTIQISNAAPLKV